MALLGTLRNYASVIFDTFDDFSAFMVILVIFGKNSLHFFVCLHFLVFFLAFSVISGFFGDC